MKSVLLGSLAICLLVCLLVIPSEARTKEERKQQRQERRRLAASDKGKDSTDGQISSIDGADTKSTVGELPAGGGRKQPLSGSDGENVGGGGRKNRGKKNNRRERISALGKTDKGNKDAEEEKDDDDEEEEEDVTHPQQLDVADGLLTSGYMDVGKEAQCVDIPSNMSMCQSIGYTKMRLPNLLHHTTIPEVVHGSSSWTSLLRSSCHPDAELFLCSLFSPVCLDQTIYPCRSLCNLVKSGCEGLMRKHGYQWPEMLSCDRLPSDNDLCIVAQSDKNVTNSSNMSRSSSTGNTSSTTGGMESTSSSNSSGMGSSDVVRDRTGVKNNRDDGRENKMAEEESGDNATCSECRQIQKFSDLQEKYCSADFVVRMSASDVLQHGTELILSSHKRVKFLKEPPSGVRWEGSNGRRRNAKKTSRSFYLSNTAQCQCLGLSQYNKGGLYVLMGRLQRSVAPGAATYRMVITYAAEYQSPALKRALRDLARNDRCGLPAAVSPPTFPNDKSSPEAATDDKKTLKVERRRIKLERRLKKIERKEKKLKTGKDSTTDGLNDDFNTLKDKQRLGISRKKIDRMNKRKQKKSDRTLVETDTVKASKPVNGKERRRQRKAQAEKRQKRLLKNEKIYNNNKKY